MEHNHSSEQRTGMTDEQISIFVEVAANPQAALNRLSSDNPIRIRIERSLEDQRRARIAGEVAAQEWAHELIN